MFTKTGITELHTAMHEQPAFLLRHVATVPDELRHKPISGFGHRSIWKKPAYLLTSEDGWVGFAGFTMQCQRLAGNLRVSVTNVA